MSDQRHAVLGIHGLHTHPEDQGLTHHPHPRRAVILRRARLISIAVLLLLAGGAVLNLAVRSSRAQALTEATTKQAQLYVTTVNPKPLGDQHGLSLPGSLQGMTEAPIYARTSGYVLRWNKDIGSQVSKGEVLAELDTPDVDQQLAQAIAARDQAAANLELARTSAERWEALRKKDAVTQQEMNERSSAYQQAKANLESAQANVRRLQTMKDFKHITAPFSGVVTRRNVETGDLIDAGNGGAAKALFSLAQTDTLRIYVYVPQAYAQKVKAGDEVFISQKELPGKKFNGKIVRSAGAIDAATRTLQVEINLPNADHQLLAGAYVDVMLPSLAGAKEMAGIGVPSNVILFRPEGTTVATVDANNKIHLKVVKIGRDLGNQLEILDGAGLGDQLVLNPPDSLEEGDAVAVRPVPAPTPAPTPAGQKKAAS